jgi:hypothetical protein
MSNVSGVSGSTAIYGSGMGGGLSPDALIAYCEMQLNSYGSQINDLINQQQQQLADQKVVNDLHSTLEQLGAPKNTGDMLKAYDAYQNAINQLPVGDPTRQALVDACGKMCSDCGYNPPQLTADQKDQVSALQNFVDNPSEATWQQAQAAELKAGTTLGEDPYKNLAQVHYGLPGTDFVSDAQLAAKAQVSALQPQGSFSGDPPDSTRWNGVCDGVNAIGSNINSSAQIQMLQLNQLSSYQQQATEQAINLMSKVDSTLLDEAKNA